MRSRLRSHDICHLICRVRLVASWHVDLLKWVIALRRSWRNPGDVMKSYSASRRCGAVAVKSRGAVAVMTTAAAFATFALTFAVATAGTSRAQDTGKVDSSWERVNSVLVVPPVYRPDATADACAEDCPSSINPGGHGSPVAVTGTADNPSNASAGTADNPSGNPTDNDSVTADGSALDGSGLQVQQAAAAAGDDQENADGVDNELGSVRDYEEQQAAAQELGSYGIVPVPSVIIGVPIGSYNVRGTSTPVSPAFPGARSLPASPAWMPQPMQKVAPLPSIVPRMVPRTMSGFPGGGFRGGFSGGFRGGSPQMSGFHGGFGHR